MFLKINKELGGDVFFIGGKGKSNLELKIGYWVVYRFIMFGFV